MTTATASPFAIAINAADAAAPEWIELIPAGPRVSGVDGRVWTMDAADAAALCAAHARPVVLDWEHGSELRAPKGERADAAGWIEALEPRGGAVWGRVSWTPEGAACVSNRAYRFISPTFAYSKSDGRIRRLVSAGLTHQPNLAVKALNREQPMDKTLLEALGLTEGADAAAVVAAVAKLKGDLATANNRAAAPDAAKFVPKADYDLVVARNRALEDGEKARKETEIKAAVEDAVKAGKIAPASRDYHLASCRAEGGLERFRAYVGAAPALLSGETGAGGKPPAAGAGAALTDEEKAVCRQLKISEADFAKAK